VDRDAVKRRLEQILSSPGFGSARRGRLLRYLVEKSLSGEPAKEYSIGVDVFDKLPDYDPRLDPSVRVEIGRLRAKLSDYYSLSDDRTGVRIEIPKGSYVPVFLPASAPPECPTANAPSLHRKSASKPIMIAVALLICIAIPAFLAWRIHPTAVIRSVVVLPFVNLTGDPRNEYLSDGVTEQLTDALAQIPTLRVVARTSAFQFKGKSEDIREIGRKVDADAVIEGSLAMLDGKLRLTVQMNRARDGYHVFSRVFEGGPHDLARLENEMTAPMLATLRPQAEIAKHTTPDAEAYDLLLRARALRGDGTRASADHAVELLHQAIERDPGYADAYAALAGVYSFEASSLAAEPMEFANQAKAAAEKALELDPNSASAHSVLGYVDSLILLDWKRGEQELRKSLAAMPQNAAVHSRLGIVLETQGRFPEAISEFEQSVHLDPLVAAPRVALGLAYFLSRNYDAALQRFNEALDLHPEVVVIHTYLGLAWEQKGNYKEAMKEYQAFDAHSAAPLPVFSAHLLAVTGKRTEALALLKEMEHPAGHQPNAFDIAAVYAALGDKDSAFKWLNRAYDSRIIWLLKVHPFLDPLRDDPRYPALLKKAGFG
jgi:TolB-like protein/Tfp pilus assembly protein PilF